MLTLGTANTEWGRARESGAELLDQVPERPDVDAVGGDRERVERLDEMVVHPIAIN